MSPEPTRDRNRDEAARWRSAAARDAGMARLARDGGYHEHACFLSQQAAEKYLKAYLYRQGEGPVIGHSTLKLAEAAAKHLPAVGDAPMRAVFKDLDAYYIPTRYPNGLVEGTPEEFFEDADSAKALGHLERVRALLEPAPDDGAAPGGA